MNRQSKTIIREPKSKKGRGLVNTLINNLPFEAHIPFYSYCGPGADLQTRLERGDQGINPLDNACKEHDIAYSQSKSLTDRHKADKILENIAWNRVKAENSSLGEKAAAWFVTNTMKTKRKIGMGHKGKGLVKKGGNLRKKQVTKPKKRIIPIPIKGGFLPLLLPILGAMQKHRNRNEKSKRDII